MNDQAIHAILQEEPKEASDLAWCSPTSIVKHDRKTGPKKRTEHEDQGFFVVSPDDIRTDLVEHRFQTSPYAPEIPKLRQRRPDPHERTASMADKELPGLRKKNMAR